MISPWHIGDPAIYHRPGDPCHGTSVEIMSELHYAGVWNGDTGKYVGHRFVHEIRSMDGVYKHVDDSGHEQTIVAERHELRRPPSPEYEEWSTEEKLTA